MRSLRVLVGTVLVVFGFAMMAIFIVIPVLVPSFNDAPFLRNTFQILFCQPNETITDSRTTYNPEPGRTVTALSLRCMDSEARSRNIESGPIVAGIVGFLVPFLIGLFMLISGAGQRQQMYAPTFMSVDRQAQSFNAMGIDINVGEDGNVTVKTPDGRVLTGHQMQAGPFNQVTGMELGTKETLTERLTELKAALDSGLITQSEYDKKRRDMINDM